MLSGDAIHAHEPRTTPRTLSPYERDSALAAFHVEHAKPDHASRIRSHKPSVFLLARALDKVLGDARTDLKLVSLLGTCVSRATHVTSRHVSLLATCVARETVRCQPSESTVSVSEGHGSGPSFR